MTQVLRPYPAYKDSGVPWLSEMPVHWRMLRGKNVFHIVDVRSRTGDEELLTVSSNDGVLPRSQKTVTMFKAESYVGHKLCWPGDLVINSLWAWMQGLGFSRHFGLVSSAYSVYRPKPEFAAGWKYLHYLLRSAVYKWELMTRSKGVWLSRLQLSDASFLDMPILLPPVDEEAAVVRYLDHIDRRIRHYIRAKHRLIALLNEQKQAIIQRAVTRGLDPNVRLKPSGVEWLGDVPEHWGVSSSKRVFSPRNERALPGDVQLSATQAYGVIPQSDFEQKVGRRVVKIFLHLDERRHVEKDDFVISMRSFQGGLERAWTSGCIRSSYVVLKPTSRVDIGYFAYLFKTPGYIGGLQATANFIRDGQDLNFRNFCLVDLPTVPLEEQRAIADFLDQATTGVNAAISRTQTEIALVREYRTRLIADVVTGKLDVREVVAALPQEVDRGDDITGEGLLTEEARMDEDVTDDVLGEPNGES